MPWTTILASRAGQGKASHASSRADRKAPSGEPSGGRTNSASVSISAVSRDWVAPHLSQISSELLDDLLHAQMTLEVGNDRWCAAVDPSDPA
jgi:hypothetical protein